MAASKALPLMLVGKVSPTRQGSTWTGHSPPEIRGHALGHGIATTSVGVKKCPKSWDLKTPVAICHGALAGNSGMNTKEYKDGHVL